MQVLNKQKCENNPDKKSKTCPKRVFSISNNICSTQKSQMSLEILKSILIIKCNFEMDCSKFKTYSSNRPNTYKKYNQQRNISSKFVHIRMSISLSKFVYSICTDVCILKILQQLLIIINYFFGFNFIQYLFVFFSQK